jgi:hypothetical protein
MLENKEVASDLNLQLRSKISSCLVGLLFLMLVLTPWINEFLFGALIVIALIAALNLHLCEFMYQKRGLRFALLSFLMHLFYYGYSGFTFLLCWAIHLFSGRKKTKR